MMDNYQKFLKELDNITIEQQRQRVLDLYPIYMFDIYCAKVINEGREKLARKNKKMYPFHDYESVRFFGGQNDY